jgi:preprotein translocase subunit SecG
MSTFLTIVHVFLCLFLIGVVLLQSGRAGGMGVLSGASSQQVFGGRGAGNFLQRVTSVVAFLFLFTCATLGYLATSTRDRGLAALSAPTGSTTVTVGTARDGGGGDASSTPASDAAPASTPTPASASTPTAEDGGASPTDASAPAESPTNEAGVRA